MAKSDVSKAKGSHSYKSEWQGDKPFAPVLVIYEQPEFEKLRLRFSDHLSPDFKGKHFHPVESCKSVSKESREIVFEYVHVHGDTSTDEILTEMNRRGLRPALYEELLAFDESYPHQQRKHPIFALGSVMDVAGERKIAYLGCDGYGLGRFLSLTRMDDIWHNRCRFLAVRK